MVTSQVKSARAVRVLGIDPGSRATGYGVIDKAGNNISFVTCGVIRTDTKKKFPARLKEIFDGINEVIDKYQPQQVGVEDIFTAINFLKLILCL